ncbi:MAG: zinc-binding dehydrogenase [Quadrisphaera sp.]
MRAVTVTTPGGPQALTVSEVDRPTPGPGQVLIRVQAAAVNPVDLQTRAGVYHQLGWVTSASVGMGWDLAGVVEEVGPAPADGAPGAGEHATALARGVLLGAPVAAVHAGVDRPLGAYADFAVLDAAAVAVRPVGLDAVAAATVPLNGTTATQALDLLGAAAGRSLLITGAAGAVGAYAVQFAVERGFAVTGLARADDEELVVEMGAVHTTVLPEGPAFDAVLDAAALGEVALGAVVDGGAYVGLIPPAVPAPVRGISTTAVMVTPDAEVLTELLRRTAAGELGARVHSELALEHVAAAHALVESGGLRGRVVLRP